MIPWDNDVDLGVWPHEHLRVDALVTAAGTVTVHCQDSMRGVFVQAIRAWLLTTRLAKSEIWKVWCLMEGGGALPDSSGR